MTPYYSDDHVTLYHARWEDVLPSLLRADVLVTDPPYGMGWKTPESPNRPKSGWTVVGDDQPFDPAGLLALGLPTVMFGANHYAERLPSSPGWIVWDKRHNMPSNDQSDAELAWTNVLTSVRTMRLTWNGGGSLLSENGEARAIHPTQKPVALMRWVIEKCPPGSVLDPYAGSGTTLVAAKSLNRKAIGVECVEAYCEVAANRLRQEVLGLVA